MKLDRAVVIFQAGVSPQIGQNCKASEFLKTNIVFI